MAGEIGVIVGYTGSVVVEGVALPFSYYKLDRKIASANYKTGGDNGFRRNTVGRKEATLTIRMPLTADIGLTGGVLYTFTLGAGVTEDGDAITLGSVDARINGMPVEVNAEDDDKVVMIEYTADVSGSFSLVS